MDLTLEVDYLGLDNFIYIILKYINKFMGSVREKIEIIENKRFASNNIENYETQSLNDDSQNIKFVIENLENIKSDIKVKLENKQTLPIKANKPKMQMKLF